MSIRNMTMAVLPIFIIIACNTKPESDSAHTLSVTSTMHVTAIPAITSSTISFTSTPFVCAENWQSLPVIPHKTGIARELYQRGITGGNNPHAFSKIGDGQISTAWFLASFDLGDDYYSLGSYQNLAPVIEYFHGSFERIGVAARRGFNTNLILDASASDSLLCNSGELPLDCELRLNQPAFIILSLGTNQIWQPEEFEMGLRRILDILVMNNVVPILSTKGDDLEEDHRINRTIACLAQEYDLPLWNFWGAIQSLQNHGLQPDLEHLTYYGINDFGDTTAMQYAWTIRNLTALQALDEVWRSVTE